MDARLILGYIYYFILIVIFILGIISVAAEDQRKKMTFLLFLFINAGIFSYLFFSGVAFVIPGIVLLFFSLILNIFVNSQELFNLGKSPESAANAIKAGFKRYRRGIIIHSALSVFFCLGVAYILFIYTDSTFEQLSMVETFNTASFKEIINSLNGKTKE